MAVAQDEYLDLYETVADAIGSVALFEGSLFWLKFKESEYDKDFEVDTLVEKSTPIPIEGFFMPSNIQDLVGGISVKTLQDSDSLLLISDRELKEKVGEFSEKDSVIVNNKMYNIMGGKTNPIPYGAILAYVFFLKVAELKEQPKAIVEKYANEENLVEEIVTEKVPYQEPEKEDYSDVFS